MPLSEFLRMARGKLESGQQKQCPTDLSARGENELVELVWENGQIMMQGHSNKVTTSHTCQNSPSKTTKARDATTTTRIGKFGGFESMLNDISPVVPSADLDLSQDDEMVPWLSYPIDDALPQDYCSQLLPEISGVTGLTPNSARNSIVTNASKGFSSKAHTLCSWGPPQQGHTLDPSIRTGISDIISNNTSNIYGNSAQGRDMVNDMKMERPNSSKVLNFSTFSRPATLVKSNFTNPDAIHASVEVKEKGSSNIEKPNSAQKDMDFNMSSAMCANTKSRQAVGKTPKEPCVHERIENLTSMKNDKPLIVEPMVASSSVGSGNSADRVSCEQTHNSKRKFRDMEDSECRSDDIETESVGVKITASGRGGVGSKRSRAAEVHNLSERRRRDRINEKMRALQELIPNCNKADKASMLDEAIEYLKTLELQVQIMSMGTGLYMPPMMFPTGMQHMHPSHIPHFSPMGLGMGMGMVYGMGMLDMNGVSHGHPFFPVPPMQGAHFPSPMAGPTNFPRIFAQNSPLYGQGLPNSVPRPPNSEDVMTNKDSKATCNDGSSIDHRTNQPKATNEVLVQPAPVEENKQATDINGHPTLTSTTETDNRAN